MKPLPGTIFYLELVLHETGLKFPFGAPYEKRSHEQMNHVAKILEILSLVEEMSLSRC